MLSVVYIKKAAPQTVRHGLRIYPPMGTPLLPSVPAHCVLQDMKSTMEKSFRIKIKADDKFGKGAGQGNPFQGPPPQSRRILLTPQPSVAGQNTRGRSLSSVPGCFPFGAGSPPQNCRLHQNVSSAHRVPIFSFS